MIKQKTIMVHDLTLDKFKKAKVAYQAEIGKELSDNKFVLELLNLMTGFQRLEVRR
jgi:hypothetical protein